MSSNKKKTDQFALIGLLVAGLYLLMAKPEGVEEFKCPICGDVFETQEELTEHIKEEHPEIPEITVSTWSISEEAIYKED